MELLRGALYMHTQSATRPATAAARCRSSDSAATLTLVWRADDAPAQSRSVARSVRRRRNNEKEKKTDLGLLQPRKQLHRVLPRGLELPDQRGFPPRLQRARLGDGRCDLVLADAGVLERSVAFGLEARDGLAHARELGLARVA
eukprot:2780149-Rhodomonas_salina.3